MPALDPLTADLAATAHAETTNDTVPSDPVGRPGLDPGALD